MKILYDDSKKRNIDTGLEEVSSKLEKCVRYAEGISVPYGFGRKGDIQTCLSVLRNSKNLIDQTQNWITKTNNGFNNSIPLFIALAATNTSGTKISSFLN